MLNRKTNTYVEIPPELVDGAKRKDAKMSVSINLVVPPHMEKKATKFIDGQMEDLSKAFKKFMKKQFEKDLDD